MPSLRSLVRPATLMVLATSLASTAQAQVLFDNGAATNAGLSVMRTDGNTLGFGAQAALANTVADDFSVAGPSWNVTGLSFFGYQTGANSTFTFSNVTWSVISGNVNSGTVVASGTTNVTNGGLAGYRVTSTTLTNQARAIFRIDADVNDFSLAAGSYWLRWSIAGSLASGPWQPPTADGVVGNAQQSLNNAPFAQALDTGDGLGVELPFIIRGTTTVVPEPSTWGMLLAGGLALAGFARRRRVA